MRILKVIHGYPPQYQAGSEVYSRTLCIALLELGHTVAVFTREEDPYRSDFELRESISNEGIHLYHINLPRAKEGILRPGVDAQFGRVLAAFSPTIVHFGHLNHLSANLVGVAKAFGAITVFTLHDFWLLCPRGQFLQTNYGSPDYYRLCDEQENAKCARECYSAFALEDGQEEDFQFWQRWIDRRMAATQEALACCDILIAPSEYLRNIFVLHRPDLALKIHLLRYGFPPQGLTRKVYPKADALYTFGYIGTHIPAKGVQLLIQAFKYLIGDGVKAKLMIWGRFSNPSTPALHQMAEGLPIEFLGEYENEKVVETVFSRIDCLVVPSIWTENSPLVIQEAQQCRIPVITANVGGMAELVAHDINGLLFEHRDPISLCEELKFAVSNPEYMIKLGLRGFLLTTNGDVIDIKDHCISLLSLLESTIAS